MKIKTMLSLLVALGFSLVGNLAVAAGTNAPPVIVDPDKDNVPAELKEIKTLIKAFDVKRDAFLAVERSLLEQLKGATAAQRAVIRQELQANRDAFLADTKAFRVEIREELVEIKHLISNAEFQRILDAARNADKRHK
jgi:hypothetical protein